MGPRTRDVGGLSGHFSSSAEFFLRVEVARGPTGLVKVHQKGMAVGLWIRVRLPGSIEARLASLRSKA